MSATPSVLTREAGTSPNPVRRAKRRPSLAHILIALAAVLAFGLNYLALQNRGSTVLVAVADESLPYGSILASGSIRLEPVPADLAGLTGLIHDGDLQSVDGWVVGSAIDEGDLVPRSALAAPATHDGLRLMSLAVPRDHAAGGTMRPGDRVDVISVEDGSAAFIAGGLEVVEVANNEGALAGGSGFFLVVAVDPDQALALASALDAGRMQVIRSTGADAVIGGPG